MQCHHSYIWKAFPSGCFCLSLFSARRHVLISVALVLRELDFGEHDWNNTAVATSMQPLNRKERTKTSKKTRIERIQTVFRFSDKQSHNLGATSCQWKKMTSWTFNTTVPITKTLGNGTIPALVTVVDPHLSNEWYPRAGAQISVLPFWSCGVQTTVHQSLKLDSVQVYNLPLSKKRSGAVRYRAALGPIRAGIDSVSLSVEHILSIATSRSKKPREAEVPVGPVSWLSFFTGN